MALDLRWTDGHSPPQRARCPGCFSEKELIPICRHCGYDEAIEDPDFAVPTLTFLADGRYRLGRVLGQSKGYSVTYLSLETAHNRRVVIKEYFPRNLAGRSGTTLVPSRPLEGGPDDYTFGLKLFAEESRKLAGLDHPNLAVVRDFFAENNTSYRVIDYVGGIGLERFLESVGGRSSRQDALAVMGPVLEALQAAHQRGVLHADLTPSNIRMVKIEDGNRLSRTPMLVDFGQARLALAERLGQRDSVVTAGYAAPEHTAQDSVIGTWSDVYSAAAVLYRMVTGLTPPPAADRLGPTDPLRPPSALNPDLPEAFEGAFLRGLALDHRVRPRSADSFLRGLSDPAPIQAASPQTPAPAPPALDSSRVPAARTERGSRDVGPAPPLMPPKQRSLALPILTLLAVGVGVVLMLILFWSAPVPPPDQTEPSKPTLTAEQRRLLSEQLAVSLTTGDAAQVKSLLAQGADADTQGRDGAPLLVQAARMGRSDLVGALLDGGADISGSSKAGVTALKAAVMIDSPDVVAILLTKNPRDRIEALKLARELKRNQIVALLEADPPGGSGSEND